MLDGEGEELGLLGGEGEEVELAPGAEQQLTNGDETPGGDGAGGGGEGDEGGDRSRVGEDEEVLGGGGEGSRAIVRLEPLKIREAIREITTANPEFAKKFPALEKSITTALFKGSQIEKFGGVQAVAEAMEAIELHGGAEEIATKLEELELHRQLEKGFERGDTKVVDGFAKDYPAGFKKLVVPTIDKLEAIDKEHFTNVASYVATKLFSEYGVFSTFAKLGEALGTLEKGKADGAISAFNQIAKFLGDMKDLSAKAKTGRDDRDAELDEERSNLAKSKRDIVYSSARMEVNPKIMFEMNRLIRLAVPRGTKVKVGRANRLRKEINAETLRRMNSDSDFSANFESLLKAGNKDRLAKFIFTRAAKHLPKVVREILNDEGLIGTGGGGSGNGERQRTGGGSGANGGGGERRTVTGKPKTSEIDFTKTDKSYWLANMHGHGQAWLLNGKQAKW